MEINSGNEKHRNSLLSSKEILDAGYRSMAEDKAREAEAQEWCNLLAGQTLKRHQSAMP